MKALIGFDLGIGACANDGLSGSRCLRMSGSLKVPGRAAQCRQTRVHMLLQVHGWSSSLLEVRAMLLLRMFWVQVTGDRVSLWNARCF